MSAVVTIEERQGWEGRERGDVVIVRGASARESVRGAAWVLAERGFVYDAVWLLAMGPIDYVRRHAGISVTFHGEVQS